MQNCAWKTTGFMGIWSWEYCSLKLGDTQCEDRSPVMMVLSQVGYEETHKCVLLEHPLVKTREDP